MLTPLRAIFLLVANRRNRSSGYGRRGRSNVRNGLSCRDIRRLFPASFQQLLSGCTIPNYVRALGAQNLAVSLLLMEITLRGRGTSNYAYALSRAVPCLHRYRETIDRITQRLNMLRTAQNIPTRYFHFMRWRHCVPAPRNPSGRLFSLDLP
jgi:hypothetical protein